MVCQKQEQNYIPIHVQDLLHRNELEKIYRQIKKRGGMTYAENGG